MANERSAQTYAQALFEQAMSHWLAPLRTIAAELEQSGVATQLDNAGIPFSKKQELLRQIVPTNAPTEAQNLMSLLASNNETALLPGIIAALDVYAHHTPYADVAKITSAVPLTDGEKRALENTLHAQYGKDIALEYVVDPAILGGLVVRAGDKIIDGSVAGKLAGLKEKLK